MSRPDAVFGPSAAMPRRPRDLRIDMFRGLALMMIFVDHVPGNPFETLTIRNFGFSDAAEAFFVMSGIAAALAYAGRFDPARTAQSGHWQAVGPVWSRAWTLYLMHLLLTVWAIAIFAGASLLFQQPDLLTQINLRQVFENPVAALAGVPLMTHQLGYVNILPVYAVLLLLVPLVLPLAARRPLAVAAGSAALWMAAGVWRLNFPNFPNPGGWFFNPFSWQAVFVCGLLIGMAMRRGQRLVPVRRPLVWLAAGYLVLSAVWLWVPPVGDFLNARMGWLATHGVPFHIVGHDKTFVSLPRLLHVLALVYLVSALPIVRTLAASRGAAPLRLMGRQGLAVFVTGTLLALAFQTVLFVNDGVLWLQVALPLVGIAAQLLVAAVREKARGTQPASPVPSQTWRSRRRAPAPAVAARH